MDDIFKNAKKLIPFAEKKLKQVLSIDDKKPKKGKIKAIWWNETYGENEFDLTHYKDHAHMLNNLGYDQHFEYGDRDAILVEVYRYTGVPEENINIKAPENPPKYIIAQIDQFDYELIVCLNVLELNQYLNSIMPIMEFDSWQKEKRLGHYSS